MALAKVEIENLEVQLRQETGRQTAQIIQDVITNPGLRHLPRYTKDNPPTSLPDSFRWLHLLSEDHPASVVLMDQYTRPEAFPGKMASLISAIGWTEKGARYEHPSSMARTIIWLDSDYRYSQKNYLVNILRLNLYSMQSSQASCESSLNVTEDEEDKIINLSLSKHLEVSGSYFTPFDIGNIKRPYSSLRGNELQVESLHLKDFRGRSASPEDIEGMIQTCQGVNIFLSRFIQQNVKRGWDYLPAVGNY